MRLFQNRINPNMQSVKESCARMHKHVRTHVHTHILHSLFEDLLHITRLVRSPISPSTTTHLIWLRVTLSLSEFKKQSWQERISNHSTHPQQCNREFQRENFGGIYRIPSTIKIKDVMSQYESRTEYFDKFSGQILFLNFLFAFFLRNSSDTVHIYIHSRKPSHLE
jgi:hypothetical protein